MSSNGLERSRSRERKNVEKDMEEAGRCEHGRGFVPMKDDTWL